MDIEDERSGNESILSNTAIVQFNFDVIFAIGRSLNVSVQNRLEKEAHDYGDILQSNASDDYKLVRNNSTPGNT